MNVRCDTAGKAPACGNCDHGAPHEIIPFECHTKPGKWFSCPSTNTVVHCIPVPAHITTSDGTRLYPGRVYATEDTHKCYYCNYEGINVNRIARLAKSHWWEKKRGDPAYCCDDAVACDQRWQEG